MEQIKNIKNRKLRLELKERTGKEFGDYMDSLTLLKHREIVASIMDKCHVNRQCVYNWKVGKSGIKKAFRIIIEECAGCKIFSE